MHLTVNTMNVGYIPSRENCYICLLIEKLDIAFFLNYLFCIFFKQMSYTVEQKVYKTRLSNPLFTR